jgi:5'-nucleotidase (lipoprotein e(P4) family)
MAKFCRLALVAFVVGCGTQETSAADNGTLADNGNDAGAAVPDSIHWFRDSAEYRASAIATYRMAAAVLAAQVAGRASGTWAVSLDVDETVLDNSLYNKQIALKQVPATTATHDDWIQSKLAVAIPGAVSFVQRVRALGGKVAFITNRKQAQCPPTSENLLAQGLPYDLLLCQNDVADKQPRWTQIENGTASPDLGPLPIVMYIGDSIADFPGGSQQLRDEPDSAFDDFGTRFVVLPNPVYGSWMNSALH